MFPIPWNRAFRKKDGTLVNMEDLSGGGGGGSDIPEHTIADAGKVLGVDENGGLAWVTVSDIPEHTSADAGKVLGVDENGDLAWATVSGGNQFSFASGEYENWNANGKAGIANAN